ncbi:MAG: DUF1549 domain-containing protein [Gemmataceae bacterium]|nr:DUF1549 domain-containing protein [Gemmataceae bacterium]
MMRDSRLALILILLAAGPGRAAPLVASPLAIVLDGPDASQQVLVRAAPSPDLTRAATYESLDPRVIAVDARGLVRPVGEGKTFLVVKHGADVVRVPVEVRGIEAPAPVSFESEVMPLLSRAGCNGGGCHGKAEGRNGFKLSVFGYDPEADHQALVMEARGRRVFAPAPEYSLFLRKAAGQVAHGGGKKIAPDGPEYRRLHRWISEGARFGAGMPAITGIEVEPKEQILAFDGTQQLRVTAIDADGKRRCVTVDAEYGSNAPSVAKVDSRGHVRAGDIPGQAAVLVRYLGHVAICRVAVPRPGVKPTRPPEANFIDKHAWDNLARLGIQAADLADDATFLRRVFLDTIGLLPTEDEARAFLADKRADKRAKLIDALLARPEYADHWAMRWSDLLRVDRDTITPAGAVAMTRWLRKQFADNRPYDGMARDILTARGNTGDEGPASIYKALATPEEMSRSFSQLFLGVRIQCAQCHHHPSEKWSQDDYFALAGFFTGIGRKTLPGGAMALHAIKGTELPHPRTKKPVPARALGATVPADFATVADRRAVLAKWMTAPENPFFARALANRLWSHYFGHGLVEPLDDMRGTNPATNEPLLDALAKHLREVKYDVKAFTRTLLESRLYQLAGRAPGAPLDEQNFSHASARAIPAEVLLDAICQVAGVPEKFNGWPKGYRAVQVWDNRMPSYFFRIFGRPVRASVCECERSNEPSIAQALHLMNSEEIAGKIRSREGTARKLADSARTPREIVDSLYLATLSRHPTAKEQSLMLRYFAEAGDDRRSAAEDVLWALVNTRGFVFNH